MEGKAKFKLNQEYPQPHDHARRNNPTDLIQNTKTHSFIYPVSMHSQIQTHTQQSNAYAYPIKQTRRQHIWHATQANPKNTSYAGVVAPVVFPG
jgi:hypothetical protein